MNILKNLSMVAAGAVFIAVLPSIKAEAATINQVDPDELTGTGLITFDDVAGGTPPGTSYNAIFESNGADFAERFVGQTLSSSGDFDILSGTPTGSLALQAGNPGHNLNIYSNRDTLNTNALAGLGPVELPNINAIGEGSFAVLFDYDQAEFGFDLLGGQGGSATVNFFGRDGSLVDTIVLGGLQNTSYGFSRDQGINDIAGISIYNNDPGGIVVDNLRSDVPGASTPVPFEFSPGLGILALGAWGLAARLNSIVRKRKALFVGSLTTNEEQAESV